METHRIKMKIGASEFDAEGPTEVVQAQFDAFLAAIAQMPSTAKASPNSALNDPAIPNAIPGAGIAPSVLNRVFRQGDILSLAALPTGDNAEPDAMLLLLYGYLKLQSESHVTGTALMKSARISGVTIERVDRVMGPLQPDYVLAAGVKKARRYQLTNRGVARAEEIISHIVQ